MLQQKSSSAVQLNGEERKQKLFEVKKIQGFVIKIPTSPPPNLRSVARSSRQSGDISMPNVSERELADGSEERGAQRDLRHRSVDHASRKSIASGWLRGIIFGSCKIESVHFDANQGTEK